MKTRRIYALSAALAILLTACSGGAENAETTAETASETTASVSESVTEASTEASSEEVTETQTEETSAEITTVSETEDTNHIDFETVLYDEYNNKACELPATCALLNFYGINAVPSELYEYIPLPTAETPAKDVLWKCWDTVGLSCYAPVIEIALQGVWVDKSITDKSVVLCLDTDLNDLLTSYVDNGNPVLVWATRELTEPVFQTAYASDGSFEYTNDVHCYIIVGYDEDSIEAYEPYYGKIVKFDRSTFEQRYNDMFKQAIVIEKAE